MGYEFGLSRRIYGVVTAVVTDNKHPEGQYRVKVKFPWIHDKDAGDKEDYVSSWARVASPFAGKGRGFYMLPEPEDEVLISFIHGDMRYPVVVGSLWNDKDLMPVNDKAPKASTDPAGNDLGIDKTCKDNKALSGKNTSRFIHTRGGLTLLFDDTDGKEKISLYTKKGHMLNINDEKDVLCIYDADKKTYLTLDAKNKSIKMHSDKDIWIDCPNGEFKLTSKTMDMKASQTGKMETGTSFDTKVGSASTWKASSTLNMESGGTMTIKGATINLN